MKIRKSLVIKASLLSALFLIFVITGGMINLKAPKISLSKLKIQQPKDYKNLHYPRLAEIQMPEVKKVTLDNGIKLFLVEDHQLPLINVSAKIRTGSIYEPADKTGLASICGEVMRTGGTKTRTGEQIDETLESIAASVETGIGLDSGSANISVLKEDIDTALEILSDILQNPAFPEDKIELAKIKRRTEISRRNDNPGFIARREYSKMIYGPNSIYARQTEYATINKITRDDLVNFHKQFYYPNNVRLAVWGDFDSDQMIKKIENAFKDWKKGNIVLPPLPDVAYQYKQTVNLVSKDDLNQSNICLGHIGTTMNDPDYFALVLMNRVLGQGFTSRLFKNIRSRMGLAYSISGNYAANYAYPGTFLVACQTKSQATIKAINAMKDEIKRITEEEVTDDELSVAMESFINTFVFNFDTKGKIISRLVDYDYYGYPEDFIFQIRRNVEKVTKKDILQVSQKHLKPDSLQILVIGRPADFDQPLDSLGSVNKIDVTIPNP
jgi:zinc protease